VKPREKILAGIALALGAYWLLRQTGAGATFEDWGISTVGAADEYVGAQASALVDTASQAIGTLTRGERNNNPGNIRKSTTTWQGQTSVQSDPAFVVFADPVSGIRALALLLRNYQSVYGLDTITQLISRWAPSTENNTGAYISSVADDMGVTSNQSLNLDDSATLTDLTSAIIRHENGRIGYPSSVIETGVERALS
jgi:hypothetical protein